MSLHFTLRVGCNELFRLSNYFQEYETPLWYPEEVFNALWHLYLKVGECNYGRPPTAGPRGVRTGKPLRPHRPELCQACSDGICRSANKEQSAQF